MACACRVSLFGFLGGAAFHFPKPSTCACPVGGNTISWDTPGSSAFPEGFAFPQDPWSGRGFGEVIKSISLPSGRINNPLSLVMDASLSCSARLPHPHRQLGCSSPYCLTKIWAWPGADLGRSSLSNPTETRFPSSTLPSASLQPRISNNFYNVWTARNKQVL